MRVRKPVMLGVTAATVASLAGCAGWGGGGGGGDANTITVLMVNNPQMVDLQQLTEEYFTAETGIRVNYTVLPENDVRDSGGLGTANLPYFIYQTFYTAQDYGRASAAGVVVVVGTIIIATAALRTAFSLFQEESR